MKKTYMIIYRVKADKPWEKVGVAFLNKDGSYNPVLDQSIEKGEKLQMREPRLKSAPAVASV